MPHWSEPQQSVVSPIDAIAEVDRQIKGIEDEKKRRTLNKIDSFFPAEGEFRRELYGKHLEFFRAGKYYRSRMFSAGNRCLTPWSPVETDRATRQSAELIGEKGFDVRSWDGSSRCTRKASPVFLRGIEQAFLLRLDNGQEVQCSGRHRVLTSSGWLSLDLLIRLSDGLRCRHRRTHSTANCAADDRRRDAPLPLGREIFRGISQQEGRAPQGSLLFSPGDVEARTRGCIHASQGAGRQSSRDGRMTLADLCGQFSDPASCIDALWSRGELRDVLKFASGLGPRPRVPEDHREAGAATCPSGIGSPSGEGSESWTSKGAGWIALSDRLEALRSSGAEFLEGADQNETFVPAFRTPFLTGGNSIVSVHMIGYQPIIDFEVAESHCYESQGLIHHNCGKTVAGAYETALHLSGDYPAWWEGRRFDRAISAWACGVSNETTKNVVQAELLGRLEKDDSASEGLLGMGTGMVPAHLIAGVEFHAQIRGAIKTAWVKHVSGKRSVLGFKSYEQSSTAFEGASIDLVWMDESADLDIYTECLMRTMTVDGCVMITATPLNGLTDLVMQFMPDGVVPATQVPV